MYKAIRNCRICGNPDLVDVVDLGEQCLTGVFPRSRQQTVTKGPLTLAKCFGGADSCGLLQLRHSYDLKELYGLNYGYRSGLNSSMVNHLHGKVKKIVKSIELNRGDLIVDIGSNDSTTLQAYTRDDLTLVGVDPTGVKFQKYYPSHIELLPDFFSSALVRKHFGEKSAKVVTSFSMFYDLEQPLAFMQQVHDILDARGIWVFEQSYMPTMLELDSYDTVCQEHLEYYGVKQIKWMADRAGLRIIDIEMNEINGGSFSVSAAKAEAPYATASNLDALLAAETASGLDGLTPYLEFAKRTERSRAALREFLNKAKADGKAVCGLGASTKGNVILQYCGITENELPVIGEVNSDKFGCFTPGTLIPICSEDEMLSREPDYLLVLPWHFREFFMQQKRYGDSKLVFPLPRLDVV